MRKIKLQFLRYKLVIFKALNGTVKVGIATYIAGVASSTWANMTFDAHMLVILSAVLAMQTFIDGFLDKTISDMEKGKSLTDTSFFTIPISQQQQTQQQDQNK